MAASSRLARYGRRADLCARMAAVSGGGGNGAGAAAAADHNAPPPPYRVQMGFGLHLGWAIEGAIGSAHKVDASYLSPHVNLASRLEAASRQFRVPLLLSRAFWSGLSPRIRKRARLLDRVTVRGSAAPLEVYTYDMDEREALEAVRRWWWQRQGWGGQGGDAAADDDPGDRFALALLARCAEEGDEWDSHPALASSWRLTEAWKAQFDAGVAAYLAGDWAAAKASLEGCCRLPRREPEGREAEGEEEEDGPTAVLLEVMGSHGYVAPEGWRGYRELTEK